MTRVPFPKLPPPSPPGRVTAPRPDLTSRPSPSAAPGGGLPVSELAEAMSEAELERGVRAILKDLRDLNRPVLAFHPWSSVNSAGGWPDWCFCGPGGVAWWELKREGEEPRDDQQEWLDALTAAGMTAVVRRPSDLLSGLMARELAALAGLAESPGGER